MKSDCSGCESFHHYPAHLTADPYYSEPASDECDHDWECPYCKEEFDSESDELLEEVT